MDGEGANANNNGVRTSGHVIVRVSAAKDRCSNEAARNGRAGLLATPDETPLPFLACTGG